MQARRLALLAFLGFFSSVACARQGAYVDLNFGMVNKSQLEKTASMITGIIGDSKHGPALAHLNYAWTLGGDLGYQLNRYLGLEGGGFWFQNGQVKAEDGDLPDTSGSFMKKNQDMGLKSWVAYLAMKAKAPIMKMVDMYAKVGAGYEHQSAQSKDNPAAASTMNDYMGRQYHWAPVLSVGIEDHLSKSVRVNLQYMYVGGKFGPLSHTADPDSSHFTAKNLYTLSLGYYFTL